MVGDLGRGADGVMLVAMSEDEGPVRHVRTDGTDLRSDVTPTGRRVGGRLVRTPSLSSSPRGGGAGRRSWIAVAAAAAVLVIVAVALGMVAVTGHEFAGSGGGSPGSWPGVVATVETAVGAWLDPQWLAPTLLRVGSLAPVVFAAVFVVLTLAGVPRSVLTVSAGWVFGPWAGVLLAWGVALLSAWLGYALARLVVAPRGRGDDRAEEPRSGDLPAAGLGGAWGAARSRLGGVLAVGRRRLQVLGGPFDDRRGALVAVVVARLVPVLPFAMVNYSCGALRVARGPFLLGSGIGLVPGAVFYAAIGAGLSAPGWPQLVALGVAVAGALAMGSSWTRRRKVAGPAPRVLG